MENLGILAALGAALAWGSYMVPFKKFPPANLVRFQLFTTIGIFISAVFVSFSLNYPFSLNLYGIVGGLLWAAGNPLSLQAVSDLGLSKALPIFLSVVIIVSFLWGVLVFNEISQGLPLAILALILIVVGVIVISATGKGEGKRTKRGIILSLSSGLLFGSQITPLKLGNLTPAEFFFPMSVGIIIFGVAFSLFKRIDLKTEGMLVGLLSGLIWNIGNLLSLITVSLIGLAKGGPLIQFQVLVAVLWGLFYFKESNQPKQKMQILIGAAIFLIGVFILAIS